MSNLLSNMGFFLGLLFLAMVASAYAQDEVNRPNTDNVHVDRDVDDRSYQELETSDDYNEKSLLFSFFGAGTDSSEARTDSLSLGLGAFVEPHFTKEIGIELGGYYLDKVYAFVDQGVLVTAEANRLHLPVLFKYWPADFFALGIGPYTSVRVGDEDRIFDDLIEQTAEGSKTWEFGADATAAVTFTIDEKTGIFAEGRYSFPFDSETRDRLQNEVTYLAGLRIEI